MKIHGYGQCVYCRELTPEAVLVRSNGYCGLCITAGRHPAGVRRVWVEGRYYTRPKRKKGSKGNPKTIRSRRNAEDAAARRLRHLFPALYRIILAEERAHRGLDPLPVVPDPPGPDEDLVAELEQAIKILRSNVS